MLFRSVRQMTAGGQVQTHDTAAGTQQTRVHGQVGRRAGVGLHVHAPLLRVQMVSLEGTGLAQLLDLVDELVTTVVAVMRVTLGVLVGEARTEALHDSSGSEVLFLTVCWSEYLRGNHLQGLPRTVLLLLDEVEEFRIVFSEGNASGLLNDDIE